MFFMHVAMQWRRTIERKIVIASDGLHPRFDIDMRACRNPLVCLTFREITHHQQGDSMIFQNAIQTK